MADRSDEQIVLGYLDLPYVGLSTYEDKRAGTGYAAVLHGRRNSSQGWCHDPDGTDPPFFWHRSEAAAWECFDAHFPGVRAAIDRLEAQRG